MSISLNQPGNSLTRRPRQILNRQILSGLVLGLTGVATAIAVGALLMVLGYLLAKGLGSLNLHVLTRGPAPEGEFGGGLRNGIVGTLIMIGLASSFGIPIGVLGGIYQIEAKGRFAWTVRFFTDVLNGIPSVVIGLFIYIAVVTSPFAGESFRFKLHYIHSSWHAAKLMAMHVRVVHFNLGLARIVLTLPPKGFTALAGGLALGILMIPTVMRTTEEILRLVPNTLREASLGLGASRWRTMCSVILPAAKNGIITGIMLAIARISGETAPLLYTALGSNQFSVKLDKPIDALPLDIFQNAISPYASDNRLALAGAIILISLIFVLSILTRLTTGKQFVEEK